MVPPTPTPPPHGGRGDYTPDPQARRSAGTIRGPLVAALLAALAVPALAADPLPVAPPPREVRPDGTRDPAPADKAEDPAEVVTRIIANARQVGDKLARTDAGAGTRATQAEIIKDIDKLLNPPPTDGGGGGGGNDNKEKDKNKDDQKKQDQKNKEGGGKGDPKKQDGFDGGGSPKPIPGKGNKGDTDPKSADNLNPGGMGQKDGQANAPRRPRAGGAQKEPGGAQAGKQPPMPAGGMPKDPGGMAQGAGFADKKGGPPPPPAAPLAVPDDVAREVWGHLPERLRQQVTQYYREEFMPRYADLLRQYYSSLANTPPGAPPPPAPPRRP